MHCCWKNQNFQTLLVRFLVKMHTNSMHICWRNQNLQTLLIRFLVKVQTNSMDFNWKDRNLQTLLVRFLVKMRTNSMHCCWFALIFIDFHSFSMRRRAPGQPQFDFAKRWCTVMMETLIQIEGRLFRISGGTVWYGLVRMLFKMLFGVSRWGNKIQERVMNKLHRRKMI